MSSMSGRKMNYLSASDLPNTGSMGSNYCNYSLPFSSLSNSGEAHVNAAYEYEDSGVSSSSSHDYEDLQSVRAQLKSGPRKKTNDFYESTRPVSPRVEQKGDRKMNYLSASDLPNTGSMGSYDSNYSLSFSSNPGDVLFNAGCDDAKTRPRKKTNDVYESTRPLPHRVRQITECSDDSMTLSVSSDEPVKKDTCLSKLILFLILAVSVTALALVILILFGKMGPKCSCTQAESELPAPGTGKKMSVQNLLRRIQDLETNMDNMMAMKEKMETRDRAVEVFVTKYENQMELLKEQVSVQKQMINETGNKLAVVDGVRVNMINTHEAFETKLDTKFRQLTKSVKALKKSDGELTSAIKKLRQNHILANGMRRRLAVNVTQLESRVQDLKKSSRNINISAENLERRYAQMNTSIKTLQAVNGPQNATHVGLLSLYNRVKDSLMRVNTTLNDKLKKSIERLDQEDINLRVLLTEVNNTLLLKVDNISKLQGPIGPTGFNGSQGPIGPVGSQGFNGSQGSQGDIDPRGFNGSQDPQGPTGPQRPQGAGDFSSCEYKTASKTESQNPVTGNTHDASVKITLAEPSGKRIVGVSCSTDLAQMYLVSSAVNPGGVRFYYCDCKGHYGSGSASVTCTMGYWQCPLSS